MKKHLRICNRLAGSLATALEYVIVLCFLPMCSCHVKGSVHEKKHNWLFVLGHILLIKGVFSGYTLI